jgi:autotransporter-associated beta strand protein
VTTDGSSRAVVLVAGSARAAGDSTGGNIIWSEDSAPTLTVGDGGQASLYTGSVSDSTGLTALVGSGSGKFRYNSTQSAANYSLALGSGVNAIYREQPTLTITDDTPDAISYGTRSPSYKFSVRGQNGDTASQALSTQATVTDDSIRSSSGYLTSGVHTLTASGAIGQLGYALSYATGSLTVNQLALSGSIADASSTYGSSLAPGAASFTNAVSGDTVSASAVSLVSPTYSTSNNVNAGSYKQSITSTLSGADSSNYTLSGGFTTSTNNYTVNQLALTGSIADASSTYGSSLAPGAATFTNAVNGDVLGTATVNVSTTGNTSTSGNLKAGTYTGVQSVTALSGADAANYTYASVVGNYTVNKANLTLTGSKLYDGTTNLDGAVTIVGLVGNETLSYTGATASASNVVTANKYINAITLGDGTNGGLASNYALPALNSTNAPVSITPASIAIDGATNTVTYTGSNQVNTGATVRINNGQSSLISTSTVNTGLGNDSFTISGYGAGTNVGTYGDNLSLTAAGNTLSSNYNITYTNGAITIGQLQSVTYVGPSGGNWSEASNWAGGARPTLNNVGTVIIPSGKTVVYDVANLSGLTPTSAIIDNGTLSFTSALPITLANTISGSGSIIQSGTGTLTLTGANTYTGSTTISAGTLIIGGSGSLGAGTGISSYAGAVSIAIGASLNYASSTSQIFSGVVSGTDLIKVSGTGALTLTGTNNTTSNPSSDTTETFYNESSNIPTLIPVATYVNQISPLPTTRSVSFLTIKISQQSSSPMTTGDSLLTEEIE